MLECYSMETFDGMATRKKVAKLQVDCLLFNYNLMQATRSRFNGIQPQGQLNQAISLTEVNLSMWRVWYYRYSDRMYRNLRQTLTTYCATFANFPQSKKNMQSTNLRIPLSQTITTLTKYIQDTILDNHNKIYHEIYFHINTFIEL